MPALRFRYQTMEFGEIDIHYRTLRDKQQFHDPAGIAEKLGISSALWPIFGVVWPSGKALANFILNYPYQNKRILEIGCGIGLSSLLLNHLSEDITATDHHPEVEAFLNINSTLNNDDNIPFVRADWNNENPELGQFDLLFGSDLLYEDHHVDLLAGFIDRHAKDKCSVIIADPGRGRHGKFKTNMLKRGFQAIRHLGGRDEESGKEYSGYIWEYCR